MLRKEALTRPITLALVAAAVVLAALIAGTSTANAAGTRLDSDPQYKGWSYVANTAPITAWKWKTGGYDKLTIDAGEVVWAHPYATGWHWAYYKKAWYVVQSKYVATWNCNAWPFAFYASERTVMYALNSTRSTSLGVLPAGDVVTQTCSNWFPDYHVGPDTVFCAALGCGPQQYLLVKAAPKPACLIPVNPETPACKPAEPANGYPLVSGYIKLPAGF